MGTFDQIADVQFPKKQTIFSFWINRAQIVLAAREKTESIRIIRAKLE